MVKRQRMEKISGGLPAAWKVKAENGKIKYWQVYCDSKIPFDTMDMNNKE